MARIRLRPGAIVLIMLDLWRAACDTSAEEDKPPLQACAAICRHTDGDIMGRMYGMLKYTCTARGKCMHYRIARWLLCGP